MSRLLVLAGVAGVAWWLGVRSERLRVYWARIFRELEWADEVLSTREEF